MASKSTDAGLPIAPTSTTATISDTGTGFVITDQRSANGIEINRRRIANSANLDDGDHIRIGDYEFTLEISST
ncbi:FHA domain-containing protein [Mycolicibacterium sp. CBMA 361]|uniref:FHA domain-containing protein n=1 Tax=Mycolicibacterium sp. CBMA 361 TaxID=2606610 RepID=UPI001EF084FE|nr:FHA domain-containing protein [Mycolicibacterium sp. CBMA 361]